MESAHHSLSRPDCNNTADVLSFTLRAALFAICGVDVEWFQERSLQALPNSKDCQCKWLQASYSAPRTFASSSAFPEKFLFCTDTAGSIGWPSPAPRQRDRWLFRDSHLWSAVKSPNFSAGGTASPVRFLQGALVILVHLQISQFRSFGKWIKTLCLPEPDTAFARGSNGNSWEELEASRCSGTLSSTRPCLNSCSHSGRSCDKFHRTSLLTWFLFGFSISAGPCDRYFFTRSLTSCWCWVLRGSPGFLRWRCWRCWCSWTWRS